MLVQPCVFRLHFQSESSALAAVDKLENQGVHSDVVQKPKADQLGTHKLIFVMPSVKEARSVLAKTKLNQGLVEVFDPMRSWGDEFTTVK